MNIAVFCSSSDKLKSEFHDDAQILGEFIGKKGFSLVYGGSKKGLMETLAKAAHANGAYVIGILPDTMREQLSEYVDEALFVESLTERKELLREYADTFVALPGGFGTLDEIFDVLAEAQVGTHDKELILVNTCGFYTPLVEQIERIFEEKFGNESNKSHYRIVNNVAECVNYLKNKEL